MEVIIAGTGIAGKACAAYLRRLTFVKSVKLIGESSVDRAVGNNYTGLWSPSLSCFKELGIYESLSPYLQAVGTSGYKSRSGSWLAQPRSEPPLAFIRNSDLHSVLDSDLQHQKVTTLSDQYVTSISSSLDDNNTVIVGIAATCIFHRAHLVIAADGMNSPLRSLWLRQIADQSPNYHVASLIAASTLQPRGYRVYRGSSSGSVNGSDSDNNQHPQQSQQQSQQSRITRISPDAFQTWGPGARFACVPTLTGNAWFAAITNPHRPDSTDSFQQKIDKLNHHGQEALIPGAFSNQSRHVGVEEWTSVKRQLRSWHPPISALIGDSSNGDSDSVGGGSGSTGVIVSDALVHSFCSDSSYLTRRRYEHDRLARDHISNDTSIYDEPLPFAHVAFVGDAAHTLDPILAQGAGLAVEDAQVLSHCLQRKFSSNFPMELFCPPQQVDNNGFQSSSGFQSGGDSRSSTANSSDSCSSSSSSSGSTDNRSRLVRYGIYHAIESLDRTRTPRIARLRQVSDIAQTMGHMESPAMIAVRDMALLAVPQMIKGPIFDIAVQAIGQPHHPLSSIAPPSLGGIDDANNKNGDNYHPFIGPTYYLGNPHTLTSNSSPSVGPGPGPPGGATTNDKVGNGLNDQTTRGMDNVSTTTSSDIDSALTLERKRSRQLFNDFFLVAGSFYFLFFIL